MNVDLDPINIYCDAWGVKRLVSFAIQRWKSPTTALGQKDTYIFDISCSLFNIFWYLEVFGYFLQMLTLEGWIHEEDLFFIEPLLGEQPHGQSEWWWG